MLMCCLVKRLDLILAGILAIMAGTAVSALACSSYTRDFNDSYGTAGTPLDSCMVCHPAGGFGLNSYGKDVKEAGVRFRAIEGRDSDGDGVPNGAEIEAWTFPGDAQSHRSDAVSARTAGLPEEPR